MRVVVTDYTFPDLAAERTASEAAGATFAAFQCKSEEEAATAVRGADIAVVQFVAFGRPALDALAPGAAVIRYGIGYDNIDVAAAKDRQVAVGYVPDYCLDEVADHTTALILAQLRKLFALDASVRRGEWAAVKVAAPLPAYSETTIGLLGLGQIGRAVVKRLAPSGFRFIVADPLLDQATATALGVEKVSAEELVAEADVLTLHAPATPDTIGFVNAERLSRMKPTAIIVNTARGALVDGAALSAALRAGRIAGAALDVFEREPLPADSPLGQAPNLILTPHAAWYSEQAIARLQKLVADDIAAWLAGRPLRKPVPGSGVAQGGGR